MYLCHNSQTDSSRKKNQRTKPTKYGSTFHFCCSFLAFCYCCLFFLSYLYFFVIIFRFNSRTWEEHEYIAIIYFVTSQVAIKMSKYLKNHNFLLLLLLLDSYFSMCARAHVFSSPHFSSLFLSAYDDFCVVFIVFIVQYTCATHVQAHEKVRGSRQIVGFANSSIRLLSSNSLKPWYKQKRTKDVLVVQYSRLTHFLEHDFDVTRGVKSLGK